MSSWIESIDVNSYVQQLLQKEVDTLNVNTNKKVTQLTTTQNGWKDQVSTYGQIQSLLNTFNQNISKLESAFDPSYQVTSANSSIATAQINGTATPGNHALNVTQLAQARRIASDTITTTDALGMTNTLTLGVGSDSFNITIGADDTLQEISDKINVGAKANNVALTSSVVTVGDGEYKLVVSSTKTGLDNAVNISETGTGSNALKISTGVGGTGTVMTEAKNAQFTLDNLSYNLASNTNNIDGLNISLLGEGAVNISVTETNSVSNVNTAMQNVVDSYNQVMTQIAKAQAANGTTDPTLSAMQNLLSNMVTTSPTLRSLGVVPMPWDEVPGFTMTLPDNTTVNMHPTGLIKLNTDSASVLPTFNAKVTEDMDAIKNELFGDNKIFTQMSDMLATSTGSVWKLLNDTQTGAIPVANRKVSDIQVQIDDTMKTLKKSKDALISKYAQLDLLLGNMQVTSQYLTAQLAANKQS